ncbi:MAG: dihydroorotate dehydrogenase [Deltaproteobacteria bacterium]|jgi:dihydroorotate dehydrogenase (NAD+) catalytic subunit|nr:dihydroorotate dehydrogenase [Deltaproteobacteria bacterium]
MNDQAPRPAPPAVGPADLAVSLGPLRLKNPVVAASGTFGYGLELADLCPPARLGAVVVKGLSLTPWPGNPLPRIIETAGGLLNSIGLENIGVEAFVRQALPPLKAAGATVGANVVGRAVEEYVGATRLLAQSEVDFLELNVSCPNLASPGGLSFGADPDAAARLTAAAVAAAEGKPLMVKLPPLVADLPLLARRVEAAGATAISLVNTLPGLAVDLETRRPKLGRGFGGLSGPPLKPLALRQTLLCARAVSVPVVGLGGAFTAEDVLEFILAGATAVQMGTAILADPTSPLKAIEGLGRWLGDHGLTGFDDLRGSLQLD